MSELKLEFVGKQVKDMYGTFMGKVVGIITDTMVQLNLSEWIAVLWV